MEEGGETITGHTVTPHGPGLFMLLTLPQTTVGDAPALSSLDSGASKLGCDYKAVVKDLNGLSSKPTHCMSFYRFCGIIINCVLQFESFEIQFCDSKDLLLSHSCCYANDQCYEPIKGGLKC